MEFRTKREAEGRIAALDEQLTLDTQKRDAAKTPDLWRYYNYSAVACSAEAARIRALLPNLPEK